MVREGYAPREKIPSEKLNIVMRGVAAKAGNILTYGDHWGEDMIVTSAALRDKRPAADGPDGRPAAGELEGGGRACSGACGWSSMTRREAIC